MSQPKKINVNVAPLEKVNDPKDSASEDTKGASSVVKPEKVEQETNEKPAVGKKEYEPCKKCDGVGVDRATDPTKYCPACDGSGRVEVK